MTDQTDDDSQDQDQDYDEKTHQDQSDAQPDAQPDDPRATDRPDNGWSTGDARVDDAVARLEGLDERDLNEHVEVYDSVHRDLADVLDDAGTPPSSA